MTQTVLKKKNFFETNLVYLFILLAALGSSILSLNEGFASDDYLIKYIVGAEDQELKKNLPPGTEYPLWRGYYAFNTGNPEAFEYNRDRGFVPWWASEKSKLTFWRPIASLSLLLDYTLWPDNPGLMHLQSILYFILLSLLALGVFRQIFGKNLTSTIAAVIFILSRVHVMPVYWLTNRHTMMAGIAGFAVFLAYIRYSREKQLPWLIFTYLLFTLALFVSEMGLVIYAYLFAYALFMEKGNIKDKIAAHIPFILITLIWRFAYNNLNFGFAGSDIYADPVNNTGHFLVSIITRFPFTLFSLFTGFPADSAVLLSDTAMAWGALISVVIIPALIFLFYRTARGSSQYAFWGSGLLLSLIPISAVLPGDRNNLFPMFGMAAVLASLFMDIFKSGEKKKVSILQKAVLGLVLFINLAGGAAGLIIIPLTKGAPRQMVKTDFGDSKELEKQTVVVVNAPMVSVSIGSVKNNIFHNKIVPGKIRYLSPGYTPIELTRTGTHSLKINAPTGYYPPPEPMGSLTSHLDFAYMLRRFDRIYLAPGEKHEKGEVISLEDVSIRIMDITKDDRIKEVEFTFHVPLEESSLKFVIWHKNRFVPYELPETGKTVTAMYES